MKRQFDESWGFAVAALILFALPWVLQSLWRSSMPDSQAGRVAYWILIAVNPLICYILGIVLGIRAGWTWLFIPLSWIAWVPVSFIPPLNASALPYGLFDSFWALVGLSVGSLTGRRRRRRRRTKPQVDLVDPWYVTPIKPRGADDAGGRLGGSA